MDFPTILDKVKDVFVWCGEKAIIPIVVSIVTNKILNSNMKKSQLPKFNIYAPEFGTTPNENDYKEKITQLDGYYKLQKLYDKKLDDFLILNNEHIKFGTQHIMNLVYTSYKNKTFNEASNYHPTKEINYVINKFKDNKKFMEILKEYEIYYNCSKWILQIENIGDSNAYDIKIDMFEENMSGAVMMYNRTLKSNDKISVMTYYFDGSIFLEGNTAMWKNDIRTKFIIIDKSKFKENKYERLFYIKYKDKFGKCHEKYCCAYVEQQKK